MVTGEAASCTVLTKPHIRRCCSELTAGSAPVPQGLDRRPQLMPVDAEFRSGQWGWAGIRRRRAWWSNCWPVTDAEFDSFRGADDTEEGPDAVRVFLTPESARQFSVLPRHLAGRPPCPALCDEPLDPEDTSVRAGYRRDVLLGVWR